MTHSLLRASASATAQAELTDAATSEPEQTSAVEADAVATTATPDLLPGVDLVTEEVEPGVYRVLSDGVRDLSSEKLCVGDAFRSDISVAPDGSVWVFGPDGSYRIGDADRASPSSPSR